MNEKIHIVNRQQLDDYFNEHGIRSLSPEDREAGFLINGPGFTLSDDMKILLTSNEYVLSLLLREQSKAITRIENIFNLIQSRKDWWRWLFR